MIEPYTSDRQCACCKHFMPETAFSVIGYRSDLSVKRHSHCKDCRAARARKPSKPGDMGDRSPSAWLLPRDERPEDDKALEPVLRNWRGPVSPEPLRWAA
jgi:hypothetical protein